MKKTSWSPDRIHKLRKRFGDTQEAFARRLGVSFVSLNRWEKGHAKPSRLAVRLLDELERG